MKTAKAYRELIDLNVKLRKALETIRDAFYTDGETNEEKIQDLKAIAHNVLYEIDNKIPNDTVTAVRYKNIIISVTKSGKKVEQLSREQLEGETEY
jgi:hypothetical protein